MTSDIVIYDDVYSSLSSLTAYLHSQGYIVQQSAESDAIPIQQFSTDPGELVFVSLRRADAIPICDNLRQDPAGAIVPIFLVGSGLEMIRSPVDALEAGGDFYYQHPLHLETIGARVRTYVSPSATPTVEIAEPTAAKAAGSDQHDANRRHVYQLLDAVRRQNYFSMLNILPDADITTIEQAYVSTRDIIAPAQRDPTLQSELAGAFSEINTILNDARDVLSDPALRQAYGQRCQAQRIG